MTRLWPAGPLDRLSRNLGILVALAEDGIPVSVPVTTTAGSLVAEVDGGVWCMFPWAPGVHVRGIDLSLTQAASLGAHLGRLHVSLGRVCGRGLLPVVPGLTTEWQYRTHCVELGRLGYRKSESRSGVARETSQVLGKVFTALRSEGTRPADVARELHLRPADLNDLIFGLVVTAQEGEGQRHDGAHNRPQLSVVR